jgi:hypothetical protein
MAKQDVKTPDSSVICATYFSKKEAAKPSNRFRHCTLTRRGYGCTCGSQVTAFRVGLTGHPGVGIPERRNLRGDLGQTS